MRIRRYWIGYDADDVERAEQALKAQLTYLECLQEQESARIEVERQRSLQRLEQLMDIRDRWLAEETRLSEDVRYGDEAS